MGFLVMIPSLIDESFATTQKYTVYIESPPSYAPSGTYQATVDALHFWEKRDGINFTILSNSGSQDIYIKWAKDLDERHVGYAFNKFIEVGLGDEYCNDTWNPFHIDYLRNILTHEVGHAIGYNHESQSDSIMNSGGREDKHYGTIVLKETLGKNWTWDTPICNFDKIADINYLVESNSNDAGFSVYLVPNAQAVSDARDGKNFRQYVQGECVGKNKIRYGGTCSVGENSYILIKNGNKFSTITLTMQEVNIPNQYYKVYASNIHKQKEIITTPSPQSDNFVTLLSAYPTLNGEKEFSYGQEGDRLCLNYLLRDAEKPDYNFLITIPYKIIQVSKQVIDINGNPITNYFTQDYKVDGSGEVRICENLELYSKNYIQNGVRYKASFAGDRDYDYSNAPIWSVYFGENQEKKHNEELERIQQEQQREQEQQRQQELADMQHEIDNLKKQQELADIHQQNVAKLEKAKQDREQKLTDEKERKLKTETQTIQSNSYDHLENLRIAVFKSEESLTKITSDTPEQKQIIDNAWNLLKSNKRLLNDITNMYQSADRQISSEDYTTAKFSYSISDKDVNQIGDNLKETSNLIDKIKQSQIEHTQPQTCFLFWCW